MGYLNQQKNKTHSGKEMVSLSDEPQILKLRKEIERNQLHAGVDLEVVFQAYTEIQVAHGHSPGKLDTTCQSCTGEMNKMLVNWFRIYDQNQASSPRVFKAVGAKPLKPLKAQKK